MTDSCVGKIASQVALIHEKAIPSLGFPEEKKGLPNPNGNE